MRLLTAFVVALAASPFAAAQDYPTKPVRIVVPFPTGGSSDALMRPIATKLGEALGQSVIVENRAGAQGVVGADAVAKSPPDGYTLLLLSGALVLSPYLMQSVPFNPETDFTPIAMLVSMPFAFFTSPREPYTSIRAVVDEARQKPGSMSIGAVDALSIVSVHALGRAAKAQFNQVNYKGAAQVVTDVMGNHIKLGISAAPAFMPFHKDGQLKVLAVTSPTRMKTLPDVPTVAEMLGTPDYDFQVWFALVGPRNMPRAAVDRLHREVAKILADPEMRQRLSDVGMDPATDTSPERVTALTRGDSQRLGALIKDAGIKPQ